MFPDVPECNSHLDGFACKHSEAQGSIVYPSYKHCLESPILLPGFSLMPRWFLTIVYGLALAWCFFGVAIISDTFMEAIEVITSAEKVVKRRTKSGQIQTITVLVWNPTVANLTLMALGSSAPEILLAVIEAVLTLGLPPGELGPSTIVGSAAFNLLMISAVCIMAVPEGQTRRISDFPVFLCTASFSVFAYLWMLIVYRFWTPNVVTLLEALLTLLFLVLLVASAYLISVRVWAKWGQQQTLLSNPVAGSGDVAGKLEAMASVPAPAAEPPKTHGYRVIAADIDGPDDFHAHVRGSELNLDGQFDDEPEAPVLPTALSEEAQALPTHTSSLAVTPTEIAKMLEGVDYNDVSSMKQAARELYQQSQDQQKKPLTAIQYKINARKAIAGRAPVGFRGLNNPASVGPEQRFKLPERNPLASITFGANAYTCTEAQGHIQLQVLCTWQPGHEEARVVVQYSTRDGQAVGGNSSEKSCDYQTSSGMLEFEPGVPSQNITIKIFEDDLPENEEEFFVDLHEMPGCPVSFLKDSASVVIMDSTEPGRFMFKEGTCEAPVTLQHVSLPVCRKNGADGKVSIKYRTEDSDARAGVHYTRTAGVLHFESGEKEKDIKIPILRGEVDKHFSVFLADPIRADLHKKRAACDVYFVADKKFGMLMKMMQSIVRRQDRGPDTPWLDQFKEAIIPAPAAGFEDQPPLRLTTTDYILHYVSITWKVIFACVPPAEYYGGGPCFAMSITFIGLLTYMVAEFAELFGCAAGLPDAVTAISFVALGTSLPDTFASRQAAMESEDADAAIGNVTGSNSVNVFLGLGLPWLISSAYYLARGELYIAPAGSLSFSVTVYMCCSAVCLALLYIKRVKFGGELGGSGFMRTGVAAILTALWLLYLILSGMEATGKISGF